MTKTIKTQLSEELTKIENRKAMLKGVIYNLVVLFAFTLHPLAGVFVAVAIVAIYEKLSALNVEASSSGKSYFYGIALIVISTIAILVLSYHAFNGILFTSDLHESVWFLRA